MKKSVLVSCLVLVVAGCSSGKFTYIQPEKNYKTNNLIRIDKPRSEVWKKILPPLRSSVFIINNLDKNSGVINISYSGNPEKYVDCGIIDSYVNDAQGERTYNFPASSEYQEYETIGDDDNLYLMERKMNLEGRIKITVQEVSPDSTFVAVNSKYVVTKKLLISNPEGEGGNLSDRVSFPTNGSASFLGSKTICYATGALEKEVLNSLGLKKIFSKVRANPGNLSRIDATKTRQPSYQQPTSRSRKSSTRYRSSAKNFSSRQSCSRQVEFLGFKHNAERYSAQCSGGRKINFSCERGYCKLH